MTDTADLIKRLRKHEHRMARDCFTMQASVLREARAEIERLRAKKLRYCHTTLGKNGREIPRSKTLYLQGDMQLVWVNEDDLIEVGEEWSDD
jgi:hypothetical protein